MAAQTRGKARAAAAVVDKPRVTRAQAAAAGNPNATHTAVVADKPKATRSTVLADKPKTTRAAAAAQKKKGGGGKAKKQSNKEAETPSLFQKKIRGLAEREQEDAAEHADNATPGGLIKTVQKEATTTAHGHKVTQKRVPSPSCDDDSSEAEIQTDMEHTTRKQRGRKGSVDIRGAVQDLRQQWENLGNIEESAMDIDDEGTSKRGTSGNGSGKNSSGEIEGSKGGEEAQEEDSNSLDAGGEGTTEENLESEENKERVEGKEIEKAEKGENENEMREEAEMGESESEMREEAEMGESESEMREEAEKGENEYGTSKEAEGEGDEEEGDELEGDDKDTPDDEFINEGSAGDEGSEMDGDEYGRGIGGVDDVETQIDETEDVDMEDGFATDAAKAPIRDTKIKASVSKRKHQAETLVSSDSDSNIEPPPHKKARQAKQPPMHIAAPKTPAPKKTTKRPAPPKTRLARTKPSHDQDEDDTRLDQGMGKKGKTTKVGTETQQKGTRDKSGGKALLKKGKDAHTTSKPNTGTRALTGAATKEKPREVPKPSGSGETGLRSRAVTCTIVGVVDEDEDEGPSDCDERNGIERAYAMNSPVKGKQRLNSQNLVKVEEKDGGLPRGHTKNDQLPPNIRGKFTKILAVIIAWMAASRNPWKADSNGLIEALNIAGRVYAGDDYTLEDGNKSPEYKMALQRLSDSWRTSIQYCGVWSLIEFFDNNPAFGDSDSKRRKWATRQLELQRFIYLRANGDDATRFGGRFKNNLVLRTFAAHLKAVEGVEWVEGLAFDMDEYPRGALALSATAAERALTLWANGSITVTRVRKAQLDKTMKIKFGPLLNSKGVETPGHAAFSSAVWGQQTKQYLTSIRSILDDEMEDIIEAATPYIKKGRCGASNQSADEDDSQGHIANGTASESEDDDDVVIIGWDRVVDLRSSSPLSELQPPANTKVTTTSESKVTKSRTQLVKPTRPSPSTLSTDSTTTASTTSNSSNSAKNSRPVMKLVPKQSRLGPPPASGDRRSTLKKATKK